MSRIPIDWVKVRRLLFGAGMIAYVLAWFLPALDMSGSEFGRLGGQWAFMFSLVPAPDFPSVSKVLYATSALTNGVLVVVLFRQLIPRWPDPGRPLLITLAILGVFNLHPFFSAEGRLLIGYYLWAGSYFLVALAPGSTPHTGGLAPSVEFHNPPPRHHQ